MKEDDRPSSGVRALPVTCRAFALPGSQETTDNVKIIRRILILQIALRWLQRRARVIALEDLRFSVELRED